MKTKMHHPDLYAVSAPVVGNLADELAGLASTAADAVSSAAGHVPGLEDYRSIARRRKMWSIVGVLALAVVAVAVIRRRQSDDADRSN
jgi:hypothetical protein